MRVLYGIELFLPHIGGAEILSAKFIAAMQERGYSFTIVTSQSAVELPEKTLYHDIPVYRFPFHAALANRDLGLLKSVHQKLVDLKKSYKPNLVHINNIGSDMFYHLYTDSAHPAPMLVTLHGIPMVKFTGNNHLFGRILRSADWTAAVSHATLVRARQIVPEINSRSSVIYNGLDMPVVQPKPLCFDDPNLLCLGRFVRHKGFDLAIEAFALLLKRFHHIRLTMVGDGPERAALERQAADLGLRRKIEFRGQIAPEQVPELMNEATIVIVPSKQEPFGLVALEAAQMARPVVAAKTGGLSEILVDGETGLLVDKGKSSSLYEGVAILLEHPNQAVSMGHAARKRAETQFSMVKYANEYDRLYTKLTEGIE